MSQLTTVERLDAFAPERSVAIETFAEPLGLNRHQVKMFRRVHGFDEVRVGDDLDLFDLVATPGHAVLSEVDREQVRYLIHAHTVLDVTPAHIDAADEIRKRLGLSNAEHFAVTNQYCASGFAAVDIAGELLRAERDPAAKALVVVGEKPFTPRIRLIAGTTMIGEASAACLIGLGDGSGGDVVRSYASTTFGFFEQGVRLSPEAINEFNDSYVEQLVPVMREAVERAGIGLADLTMVVPHNVSRLLWLRTIEALGVERERVYLDTISRYSHCFCVDPFLNFVSLRNEGRLIDGGLYLLTSVGLGAAYAAMVLEHHGAQG